jgi:hypothetical protein
MERSGGEGAVDVEDVDVEQRDSRGANEEARWKERRGEEMQTKGMCLRSYRWEPRCKAWFGDYSAAFNGMNNGVFYLLIALSPALCGYANVIYFVSAYM